MRKLVCILLPIAVVIGLMFVTPRTWPQSPIKVITPGVQSPMGPTITWSAPNIEEAIFPGASSIVTVTFQSDRDLAGLTVVPTASLAGLVSVSPSSFAPVTANRTYQINLTLIAPEVFTKRSFGGTVQLRNGGAPSKTYAQPLAVTIRRDFSSYSNPDIGVQLFIPVNMLATSISNSTGTSIYIHDNDEEFAGGGITITKSTQSLSDVLTQIAVALTLTSSSTQIYSGKSWTLNTYIDESSGQQFIDAFTVNNGAVYQIGGLASQSMLSLLPGILSGFVFI